MIRILLVDDQKTIREALRAMLNSAPDLEVVGTASDGHTAIEQVSILNPDVVLIDMEMPGLDGVSATKIITQQSPEVKVLVLSMHDDEARIAQSMHAGAMGYLLKNTPPQELRAAIRFVQRGYAQIGPGLLDKVVSVGESQNLKNGYRNGKNNHGSMNGAMASTQDTLPPQVQRYPGPSEEIGLAEQEATVAHAQSNGLGLGLGLSNGNYSQSANSELPLVYLEQDLTERKATLPPERWKRYLVLGVLLNVMLWTAAIAILKYKRPLYTSSWTLDLPAARSDTFIEVPGVGRANQSDSSPYNHIMVADPRTNYKDIIDSSEVLIQAAKTVNIPASEFIPPRTEVVPNTTLIKIATTGLSPREAYQTALAVQSAFEAKVGALRKQELAQQNQSLKVALDSASDRLKSSQARLSTFKVQSGIDSGEQLRDLSVNIESLRRQRSEVMSQMQDSANQLEQLSGNLNLSSELAGDAFTLQSDALFQQYLLSYSSTSGELSSLESALSTTHPKVIDKAEESRAAYDRLMQRGQQILGRPVNEALLKQISVSNGRTETQRGPLFSKIITLKGEQEGFKGRAAELDKQVRQLEAQMTEMSKKKSVLATLERDVQIAEAIFTSTLGKLDWTKSSFSPAYPQVTMRTKPNIPKLPSSPKVVPIFLGTLLASILVSAGLISLWLRDRRLQRLRFEKEQGLLPNLRPRPQIQGGPPIPSLPGQE